MAQAFSVSKVLQRFRTKALHLRSTWDVSYNTKHSSFSWSYVKNITQHLSRPIFNVLLNKVNIIVSWVFLKGLAKDQDWVVWCFCPNPSSYVTIYCFHLLYQKSIHPIFPVEDISTLVPTSGHGRMGLSSAGQWDVWGWGWWPRPEGLAEAWNKGVCDNDRS